MVFGILLAMLILSGVISIGAVEPVLGIFLFFVALSLIHMTLCVVPGYVKIRTACSPTRAISRAPQAAGTAIVGSEG